jgi:hypothetical protein
VAGLLWPSPLSLQTHPSPHLPHLPTPSHSSSSIHLRMHDPWWGRWGRAGAGSRVHHHHRDCHWQCRSGCTGRPGALMLRARLGSGPCWVLHQPSAPPPPPHTHTHCGTLVYEHGERGLGPPPESCALTRRCAGGREGRVTSRHWHCQWHLVGNQATPTPPSTLPKLPHIHT